MVVIQDNPSQLPTLRYFYAQCYTGARHPLNSLCCFTVNHIRELLSFKANKTKLY